MSARRTICAIAAAAAGFAGCAGPVSPAAGFEGCKAYGDQQVAQRAWERAGKPAGADGDRDGRICEALAHKDSERRACRRVDRVLVVAVSAGRYPYTADHIVDAIGVGEPQVLHIDRAGADSNRQESLRGIPTRAGFDRDEYPPAVSREGGAGADVRYVPSSDNRGAGSVMGERLQPYCDGQRFRLQVTPGSGAVTALQDTSAGAAKALGSMRSGVAVSAALIRARAACEVGVGPADIARAVLSGGERLDRSRTPCLAGGTGDVGRAVPRWAAPCELNERSCKWSCKSTGPAHRPGRRGAGSVMGQRLEPYCEGQRFGLRVTGRGAR